jgi:hypothetical protein
VVAAACGDDAPSNSAAVGGGGSAGASSAGKSAGSAGASSAGKSAGGTANGGVGGKSTSGGFANDAGASASGGESPNAGGVAGTAGATLGGAPSDAGAPNGLGGSAAGDSSAGSAGASGSAGDCAVGGDDKLIFVSSTLYTGSLGGLGGADSKCQALADDAKLCGTFKAWLSDATGNAADRLTQATGNYVLTTGQVVANGWTGLTTLTLLHAINVTEAKGAAPVGTVKCGGSPLTPVWTGADRTGVPPQNGSCSDWGSTSTTPGGVFGNADATNGAWSGACQLTTVCAQTAALYCVQQ